MTKRERYYDKMKELQVFINTNKQTPKICKDDI